VPALSFEIDDRQLPPTSSRPTQGPDWGGRCPTWKWYGSASARTPCRRSRAS